MSNINKLFLQIRVYFELRKFYFLNLIIYTKQNICVHPEKKINLKIIFYLWKCLFINSTEKLRQTTIEISYAWRNVKTLICHFSYIPNMIDKLLWLILVFGDNSKRKKTLNKAKMNVEKTATKFKYWCLSCFYDTLYFFWIWYFCFESFLLTIFFFYKCNVISISS